MQINKASTMHKSRKQNLILRHHGTDNKISNRMDKIRDYLG